MLRRECRPEIACELQLEIKSVVDRLSSDAGVKPVDLRRRQAACGQRAERLGLQPSMSDVRRTAELAGNNSKPRPWSMKIRTAGALLGHEWCGDTQELVLARRKRPLTMRNVSIGLGQHDDVAATVDGDGRAGILAPQAQVELGQLA